MPLGACPQSPFSSRPSPQPQRISWGARIVVPNLDLFNRPFGVTSIGRAAYGRRSGNRSLSVLARGALRHSRLRAARNGTEERDLRLLAPGTGLPQLAVTETLTIGRSPGWAHVLVSTVT